MNNYTLKINPAQGQKIKNLFEKENAVFDTVQYSFWRAKTAEYQAVYYTSGKLLIQGKETERITAETNAVLGIKAEKAETFGTAKASLIDTHGEKYIGTDESGKGDFFGPLIAAGVQSDDALNKKFADLGIKDSKKMKDSEILKAANFIKATAVHSVVVIMPEKYNELYKKFNNLNKLLAWAHARAIENILEKSPCRYALADKFGDESLIQNALMKNGRNIILKQCVRAEADSACAAASVLARAEFVKRMQDISKKYEINFSKGVSEAVEKQAKDFIKRYSADRLNEIAKLHFKTADKITG